MLCSNTVLPDTGVSHLWSLQSQTQPVNKWSKSGGRTGTRAGDLCHSPAPCLHLDKAFSFILECVVLQGHAWNLWRYQIGIHERKRYCLRCLRRHSSPHHRECISNDFSTKVAVFNVLFDTTSRTFNELSLWANKGWGWGVIWSQPPTVFLVFNAGSNKNNSSPSQSHEMRSSHDQLIHSYLHEATQWQRGEKICFLWFGGALRANAVGGGLKMQTVCDNGSRLDSKHTSQCTVCGLSSWDAHTHTHTHSFNSH